MVAHRSFDMPSFQHHDSIYIHYLSAIQTNKSRQPGERTHDKTGMVESAFSRSIRTPYGFHQATRDRQQPRYNP